MFNIIEKFKDQFKTIVEKYKPVEITVDPTLKQKMLERGDTEQEINAKFGVKSDVVQPTENITQLPEKENYLAKFNERLKARTEGVLQEGQELKIKQEEGKINKITQTIAEGGLGAKLSLETGFDFILTNISNLAEKISRTEDVPEKLKEKVLPAVQKFFETESGKSVLEMLEEGEQVWKKFEEKNPNLANAALGIARISEAIPAKYLAKKGVRTTEKLIKKTEDMQPGLSIKDVSKGIKLYRGDVEGKVTEELKSFSKIKDIKGGQSSALKELAEAGNKKARSLLEDSKSSFNDYDKFLDDYYKKKNYDAIKYTNQDIKGKSLEYRDLIKGGSLTPDKTTAEIHSLGKTTKRINEIKKVPETFQGFDDLTLKTIEKLKGKTKVSKQFISDLTNASDLKQAERDLVRRVLDDMPEGKVNAKDFANKVKTELLPLRKKISGLNPRLKRPITKEKAKIVLKEGNPINVNFGGNIGEKTIFNIEEFNDLYKKGWTKPISFSKPIHQTFNSQYENITLPDNLRGSIANYYENLYESPIKTSAGGIHFKEISDNYFAHTRIEDMADNKTRRIIELQSDLFQKGNLKREVLGMGEKNRGYDYDYEKLRENLREIERRYPQDVNKDYYKSEKKTLDAYDKMLKDKNKLNPYRNTYHERIIKEEIKKASQDGKKILQFPTGETAMKIEGLGDESNWSINRPGRADLQLNESNLKVGTVINNSADNLNFQLDWIITDVLGNGKFKAAPKEKYDIYIKNKNNLFESKKLLDNVTEQFDISGKVDTSNPIYKFYEKDIQKYLKRIRPGMKRITDKQGVEWFQIPIGSSEKNFPIEAFSALPLLINKKEEE